MAWGVAWSVDLALLLGIVSRHRRCCGAEWRGACLHFVCTLDRSSQGNQDRGADALLLYNGDMRRTAVARNGAAPSPAIESRREAAADALGLLRAEGLEPSPAHEALAARWVAGEIDDEQFELLNLEQVRERLAATAGR